MVAVGGAEDLVLAADMCARVESLGALVEESVLCEAGTRRGECRGRVLESVLMLVLLRRTVLEAAAAARLAEYLERDMRLGSAAPARARTGASGPCRRVFRSGCRSW
ncbi:hypothetical protein GCM10023086_76260 [Streptomyces venetus]|uniref:Transposase InsH N-terminal domain-containing protein n=1 Tax=Streptomyces venetus TaxID=1701086 RepID=A0ABP8HKK7_9ACTN